MGFSKLLFAAFFLFSFSSGASAIQLEHEQLKFMYQEQLEPYGSAPCKHEKDTVGLFEWKVYCLINEKVHRYAVHLVVNFYPKTIHGLGAYEVMYWLTDRSFTGAPRFDSTTVWIHNSNEDNKANVLELKQGIENDMSTMNLTITL